MTGKKKRLVSIIALAMTAVLTLTACGSKPTTTTTPTTTPTGTPVETVTPTGTPTETTTPTTSPTSFKQSPYLDDKGLADVKERLPKEPKLTNELTTDQLTYEIGQYGGDLNTVTASLDWDADVFVACNEPLLNTPGMGGVEVTGNVLKGYEANADTTEFTFFMREGLKWSDGEPVTIKDVRLTYENIIMNKEIMPVIPGWMCSGGSVDGTPLKMEFIDDWTFKVIFDQPYGGFLNHISINGWKGYTEFMKPWHFLSKYHKDMPEYDEALSKDAAAKNAIGEDASRWFNVFNKVDITNWELCQKVGIGFPGLYPWMLTEAGDQTYLYVRNPYYFKVDAEGNQLPYIDEVKSETVQDMEMVTMKTLAGEVDFSRESASLTNISMYKENEKNGYTTLLCNMHVTPTDFGINMTYGKDQSWKDVVRNVEFRKALNYAIDREEIVDAIYYGYAEPTTIQDSEFSVEKATALLDKIGMDKKGKDGMRLTPDGKPFEILFEVGAEAPDIVPFTELLCEMWKAVGVNAKMKRIESSLVGNKTAANELQGRVIWTHTPLWFAQDWGFDMWGRAWQIWRTKTKDVEITNDDGTKTKQAVKGEEPPEAVKELYALSDSLLVVSPDKVPEVFQQLKDSMKENLWYFTYIQNVKQPVIVNAKMGNVTDKVYGIGLDFALEQTFFKK